MSQYKIEKAIKNYLSRRTYKRDCPRKGAEKILIFSGAKSCFLTALLQHVEKSNKLSKTAANYVCVVVKTNAGPDWLQTLTVTVDLNSD